MKKIYTLVILLIVLSWHHVQGQSYGQGRLYARIERTIGYIRDGDSPEYVHIFNFDGNGDKRLNAWDGADRAEWYTKSMVIYDGYYDNTPGFKLLMYRAFEYDDGTNDGITGKVPFLLYPLEYEASGKSSYLMIYKDESCKITGERFETLEDFEDKVNELQSRNCSKYFIYGAELYMEYEPPKPSIEVGGEVSQRCFDDTLTFKVEIPSEFERSGTRFQLRYGFKGDETSHWECEPNPAYCGPCQETNSEDVISPSYIPPDHLPCCDEDPQICTKVSEQRWRTLPESYYDIVYNTLSMDTIKVRIGDLPGIDDYVKQNAALTLMFQVRTYVDNTYGAYSANDNIDVASAAPTYIITGTTPSCSGGKSTGTISISNIEGVGSYRYFVQSGRCTDPEAGECLGLPVRSSVYFSGSSVTIPELPPSGEDTYYVYVANNGGDLGNCATLQTVTIDSIPQPQVASISSVDVSCPEGADGSIQFEVTQGMDGSFAYSLTPEAGQLHPDSDVRKGQFSGLPSGEYTLSATDACEVKATKAITVYQPAKVSATVTGANPTCSNEPNGVLSVEGQFDASYATYVRAPSEQYTYRLEDASGTAVSSYRDTTSSQVTFAGQPAGSYTVYTSDAARATCAPFTSAISLLPPEPLVLTLDTAIDISCYDMGDGIINISGTGGYGQHLFRVSTGEAAQTFSNTDGQFSALPPGAYTLTMQNDLAGCSDNVGLPDKITLTQPDEMILTVDKKEITCHGSDNGALDVQTSGLLSAYRFSWYYNDAVYRNGDENSETDIEALFPGRYYLSVTNSNGCNKTSKEVTLAEPELLIIDAVEQDNPECYGETDGRIVPHVSGGWGNYQYYYHTDATTAWTPYQTTDQFSPDTYYVKVEDREGCQTEYPEAIIFRAPDSPLDISTSLLSRNGYGVSCFDSADGEVDLEGDGGITFENNGYLYSVDGSTYDNNPHISGLASGLQTFYIKDANGCVETATLELVAPDALDIALVDKTDVRCFGDYSGSITMVANGGVSPYQYYMSEEDLQDNPEFEQLSSGTYHLYALDDNGCTAMQEVTLDDLNPAIDLQSTVTDVSCFGYGDGAISTSVSGGAAPYTYEWSHLAYTQEVTDLDTGAYVLTVHDAEGCQYEETFVISQPDNVNVGPDVTLCKDQTYTADATYPVPGAAYTWSASSGHYADGPEATLSVGGQYQVEVTLPDGCVMHDELLVTVKDIDFDVNFLTASEIYEGDTLVMVDVTYPEPDSVSWQLGGDIVLIDSTSGHPQMQYNLAGDYDIGFTAYYAGCQDEQTKTVHVYTQDALPEEGRLYFGESGIKGLQVYPNPTAGPIEVLLQLHRSGDATVEIFDTYGHMRASKTFYGRDFYATTFDLSGMQNGIYLLQVVAQDDKQVVKLMVNK